jgi:hypothetical protein
LSLLVHNSVLATAGSGDGGFGDEHCQLATTGV